MHWWVFKSYLFLVSTLLGRKLWCRRSIWTTLWLWKGRNWYTWDTLAFCDHSLLLSCECLTWSGLGRKMNRTPSKSWARETAWLHGSSMWVCLLMLLSVSPQISVHYPPPELLPLSNYLFFLDKMINHFVRVIPFSIIHFLIVLALGFIFIIYFMTTSPPSG